MIRTFIVEDELMARNELNRFLSEDKDFEVVGQAQDGDEALTQIKTQKPDLVFLDIHIPKLNGLEVASAISKMEHPPLIIFVTAYDKYAIEAFDVNALDYMLKPYDSARFKKAIDRAKKELSNRKQVKEKLTTFTEYVKKTKPLKLMGHERNSKERVFIHPHQVLYFHAQLTEVTVHLMTGEELLVNATLKSLLEMLSPDRFQQVHRAHIVNLDQVEKVTPMFAGNFSLILRGKNKISLPLSRRYARKLKQILKW